MEQNIRKKRVGIMGGTFDPIHIGHLIMAERAYEQYQLDEILFMPSGRPPHKRDRNDVAAEDHRKKMVELAIRDNSHFILDTEEMERAGLTYTNETVRMLDTAHPENEYYFIIGGDSLMAFDTWKNPEIICQHCSLLVAVRDNLSSETMNHKIRELSEKFQARIHLIQSPNIDVSSTELRDRVRNGLSLRYFVPDPVIEYIITNRIYL